MRFFCGAWTQQKHPARLSTGTNQRRSCVRSRRGNACRQQDRNYSALWIAAADLQCEGLLLSRHMLLDHFPDRALAILRRTLSQLEAAPLASSGGPSVVSRRASGGAGAAVGMAAVGGCGSGSPAALQPPRVQAAVYCRGAPTRRRCLRARAFRIDPLNLATACMFRVS